MKCAKICTARKISTFTIMLWAYIMKLKNNSENGTLITFQYHIDRNYVKRMKMALRIINPIIKVFLD